MKPFNLSEGVDMTAMDITKYAEVKGPLTCNGQEGVFLELGEVVEILMEFPKDNIMRVFGLESRLIQYIDGESLTSLDPSDQRAEEVASDARNELELYSGIYDGTYTWGNDVQDV